MKLGHFDVFDMFFPFLAFFKLWPIILRYPSFIALVQHCLLLIYARKPFSVPQVVVTLVLLWINHSRSMKPRVNAVCKSSFSISVTLAFIHIYFTHNSAKIIIQALIVSILAYIVTHYYMDFRLFFKLLKS